MPIDANDPTGADSTGADDVVDATDAALHTDGELDGDLLDIVAGGSGDAGDAPDLSDDAARELDDDLVEATDGDLLDDDQLGDEDLGDDDFELEDPDGELSGDAALVARARKKYGIGGAILAGGMLGLDRMLSGKVKQDAPVEWEAPGEPRDIDRNGITMALEDERVVRSKPGPPAAPGAVSRRVTRRRRP